MQALILAAGKSSRFYPYNTFHKSLIKLMGEPIISHTIRSVKKAGITDIVIVTGPDSVFKELLGSGKKFGVKIEYVVQKKPTGMGDAVLAASHLIKSDFFLLHAHRIDFHELKEDIDLGRGTNKYVVLLAKKEEFLVSYGTLRTKGDQVVDIIEKPEKGKEPSKFKIIGLYFLNNEFIKTLKSVGPHEYSFEEALNKHAKQGKVRYTTTKQESVTLKYPWDLLCVKKYLLKRMKRHISKESNIASNATIIGDVFIEKNAVVCENVTIKGPSYIGRNVFVGSNSLIRNNTDIEEDSLIGAYMEIKNSLVLEGSSTHSGFIGDSIIGRRCKIGGIFSTANVRLDRNMVKVKLAEKAVDTGLKSLGAMIGDNTVIGNRVSLMPGVLIGNNVNIGPSTTVIKNIPSDSIFYTKFSETIFKKKPAPVEKAK